MLKASRSKGEQVDIKQFTVKQEKVVAYSDELFRQVALEWLIATDQVCATSVILDSTRELM